MSDTKNDPLYVRVGDAEVSLLKLRDYFAARAPRKPWEHFRPVVGPRPTAPDLNILSHEPLASRSLSLQHQQYIASLASDWQRDPCFDLESYRAPEGCTPDFAEAIDAGRPVLATYERAWRAHWNDVVEWEKGWSLALLVQWPWFYADAMLAERERAE